MMIVGQSIIYPAIPARPHRPSLEPTKLEIQIFFAQTLSWNASAIEGLSKQNLDFQFCFRVGTETTPPRPFDPTN